MVVNNFKKKSLLFHLELKVANSASAEATNRKTSAFHIVVIEDMHFHAILMYFNLLIPKNLDIPLQVNLYFAHSPSRDHLFTLLCLNDPADKPSASISNTTHWFIGTHLFWSLDKWPQLIIGSSYLLHVLSSDVTEALNTMLHWLSDINIHPRCWICHHWVISTTMWPVTQTDQWRIWSSSKKVILVFYLQFAFECLMK